MEDQGKDFGQNGTTPLFGLAAGKEGRDADVPDLGEWNSRLGLIGEGDDIGVVAMPQEFEIDGCISPERAQQKRFKDIAGINRISISRDIVLRSGVKMPSFS
jgi:hypothetical protein